MVVSGTSCDARGFLLPWLTKPILSDTTVFNGPVYEPQITNACKRKGQPPPAPIDIMQTPNAHGQTRHKHYPAKNQQRIINNVRFSQIYEDVSKKMHTVNKRNKIPIFRSRCPTGERKKFYQTGFYRLVKTYSSSNLFLYYPSLAKDCHLPHHISQAATLDRGSIHSPEKRNLRSSGASRSQLDYPATGTSKVVKLLSRSEMGGVFLGGKLFCGCQ